MTGLGALERTVDDGANASLLPIFHTASLVGFGAVIASPAAFTLIRNGVLGLGGGNPLILLAIAMNVLADMTGSASRGISIALSTLGDTYLAMAAMPMSLIAPIVLITLGTVFGSF